MKYILCLFILCVSFKVSAQDTHKFILYNIHIVDVESGKIVSGKSVKINNGRIEAIGKLSRLKAQDFEIIDGNGNYLIPGLWDMHVHIEGENLVEDNIALFAVYLAHGITTIRDAASDLGEQVLTFRAEINEGKRMGPTIYTAGKKLEGLNSIWKGDLEISNEAELKQMLDKLDGYKVDFIKITENTLEGPLFLKSVMAAKKRGYLVSGHVPIDLPIADLANAGFSSIEHASYLLRLGSDEHAMVKDLLAGKITRAQADQLYYKNFDQAKAIEGYKMLAGKKVAVTPTLIGGRQLAFLEENNHKQDDFLKYLTRRFVSNYQWRIDRMANETPAQKQERKEKYELIAKQIPLLQKAGVLILAGSDAAALNTYVYPAASLIEELELFQDEGMRPIDILRAATINGAMFMKKYDEVGTVSAGKRADLVLLASNPLENISAVKNIESVIVRGTLYNRSSLDTMLNKAIQKKIELDSTRKE